MATFIQKLFLFSFLINFSSQCIALGCMGGFGGCGSSCLFGLCLSPPIIQPIGCPCGSGFFCMRGACVARAAGAKTFQDDTSKHIQTDQSIPENYPKKFQTPDEHFKTCCKLLDISSSCGQICSYDQYSTEQISSSILLQSTCSLNEFTKIHFCAARGANHTECCKRNRIPQMCQSFCDQSNQYTIGLTVDKLQCIDHFDDMKECFLEYAVSEYYNNYQVSHNSHF